MPEAEREVFDLLWYQGMTQEEAADLLGLSLSTVRRRWQAARLRLYEALGGELPVF
jgi:RNA polymerase sigma-70 factor (ECF subfamily)